MIAIAITAAVAAVSGCGAADSGQSVDSRIGTEGTSASTRRMVDFLRSTVSYDYQGAASPQDLLKTVAIGASGTVQSVESVLITDDMESTGGVLVTLALNDTWKTPTKEAPKSLQIIIRRPTNVGIEMYKKALPVGTLVGFLGHRNTLNIQNHPATETAVFEPDPQGLFFDAPDGSLVNVWGEEESKGAGWRGVTSVESLARILGD